MKMSVRLLEEYAERCIQLAYQCQNGKTERFFRLLAVDLMLAAEQQRPRRKQIADELSELSQLSSKAARVPLKPENVSIT